MIRSDDRAALSHVRWIGDRAVWLLPTPAFREMAVAKRGTMWDIPCRTSDPARARDNILARDALFTDRLRRDIDALGLHARTVDGSLSADGLADALQAHLFAA